MATHIGHRLAISFMERHNALSLGSGKRAADAALHYFIGASKALELTGNTDDARILGTCAVMLIAPRGIDAVRELATYAAMDTDGAAYSEANFTESPGSGHWVVQFQEIGAGGAWKYASGHFPTVDKAMAECARLKLANQSTIYRALARHVTES